MQLQANVTVPRLPLFAATSSSDTPLVCFLHPHETTAANMLLSERGGSGGPGGSGSSGGTLRLLLSEEGTYCHVSLVAFHEAFDSSTTATSHTILFHDKLRVKSDNFSKVARGMKSKPINNEGSFITTAPQFVRRLQTEVTRALHIRGGAAQNWKWQDISSVHFIANESNGSGSGSGASSVAAAEKTDSSALRLWVEAALVADISQLSSDRDSDKDKVKDSDVVRVYSCPHTRDISHLHCATTSDGPCPSTTSVPLLLGSAVGLRVENFTPTITSTEDVGMSNESAEVNTFCQENEEFIPFLEPFQTVPACVRRRLCGTRPQSSLSADSSLAEVDLVLDVVEESRCCNGGRGVSRCCSGGTSISRKGRILHSILCGVASLNAAVNEANIDLLVEICVDINRNVSLRVIDAENEAAEVTISTSLSSEVSATPSSRLLRSMRRVLAKQDRCVREPEKATRWSCADLAADYKLRGNVYMKCVDYVGAIEMYTVGLSCAASGEPSGVLASNRQDVSFNLHLF